MSVENIQDGYLWFYGKNSEGYVNLTFNSIVCADTAQGCGGFLNNSGPLYDDNGQEVDVNAISRADSNVTKSREIWKRHTSKTSNKTDCRSIVAPNNICNQVFFKFPLQMTTLCYSEWLTSYKLFKEICPFMPNFMRPYGIMKNRTISEFKHLPDESIRIDDVYDHNVFSLPKNSRLKQTDSLNGISISRRVVDVAVFESLKGCKSAADSLVRSGDEVMASVTYQLMMAVLVAQQKIHFVHNDLHWGNVFLVKCDPKQQILYQYRTSCGKMIRVRIPTHGVIPIIIDYGFSYSSALIGHHPEVMYADNYGYITYEMDNSVDMLHLLHEYSNYSRSQLSTEIKSFLHSARINRGRDATADRPREKNVDEFKPKRPSWEIPERKLTLAMFMALIRQHKKKYSNDWRLRTVYDAVVSYGESNSVVPYNQRVNDLNLKFLNLTHKTHSFSEFPESILLIHFERLVSLICNGGTRTQPRNCSFERSSHIKTSLIRCLSKAVRMNTSAAKFDMLKNVNGTMFAEAQLRKNNPHRNNNHQDDNKKKQSEEKDEYVYLLRLKLRDACITFVHEATKCLSTLTLLPNDVNANETNDLINRTKQSINNRELCEQAVSVLYALAAKRSQKIYDTTEHEVSHIKQGIKLPIGIYVDIGENPDVSTFTEQMFNYLVLWDLWADTAGVADKNGNPTRIKPELEYVVSRYLSDTIRSCSKLRSNLNNVYQRLPCPGEAVYRIDIDHARQKFITNLERELQNFNSNNLNSNGNREYDADVMSAIERSRSYEIDWHTIIQHKASIIATAGNNLESLVRRLRNYRRDNVRMRTGSGESMFLRFQSQLQENAKMRSNSELSANDPLLVIDTVNNKSWNTVVGIVEKKKEHQSAATTMCFSVAKTVAQSPTLNNLKKQSLSRWVDEPCSKSKRQKFV